MRLMEKKTCLADSIAYGGEKFISTDYEVTSSVGSS